MDETDLRHLVEEALSEVSFVRHRVKPSAFRIRRIFRKNDYTWLVGFWLKSYAPEIEVIETPGSTPTSIRAAIASAVEERLGKWNQIAEDREARG